MKLSLWKALLLYLAILLIAYLIIPSRRELGRVHLAQKEYESARPYLEEHYEEYPEDIPNTLRYLQTLDQELEFTEYDQVANRLLQEDPNDLRVQRELATHYEGNLEMEKAASHWEKIIQLAPKDTESRDKLISYYRLAQNYPALVSLYLKTIDEGVATPDIYYDLARIYLTQNQEPKARAVYGALLTHWPDEVPAKVQLAELWEEEGRIDEALAMYEIAAEESPSDKYAATRFLEKSLKYRKGVGSQPALDRYLKRFSSDPELLLVAANQQFQMGQSKKALTTIAQIQAVDPQNIEALLLESRIYVAMKQPEKAISEIEEYLKANPPDFRLYAQLGDLYQKSGNGQKATADYQMAAQLFHQQEYHSLDEELIYLWTEVALKNQKTILARTEELFNEYPGNPDVAQLLFTVAIANEKNDLAEKAYHAYLASSPESPGRLEMAADLYVAQKRWKEARAVYEKILAGSDVTPANRRDYATVLFNLNEFDLALAQLKAVEQLEPNNPANSLLASEIYTKQKKLEEAIAQLVLYNKQTGGDLSSYAALGDLYSATKKEKEAEVAWKKGVEKAKELEGRGALSEADRIAFAWLYVNLKEIELAHRVINPLLLSNRPLSAPVLGIAAQIAIEEKAYCDLLVYTNQLAQLIGDRAPDVVQLRIARAVGLRCWTEAESWLLIAMEQKPDNIPLMTEYASVLTSLQRYPHARRVYRELCALGAHDRLFRWDQRQAYFEGGNNLFAQYEYLWGEEGIRLTYYREGARVWLNECVRATGTLLEAKYNQFGIGGIQQAFQDWFYGFDLQTEWFQNAYFTGSALAGFRTLNGTYFPLVGAGEFYRNHNFAAGLSGFYNELVGLPANALPLQCRLSRARLSAENIWCDFFRYGAAYFWEWYRMNPNLNPFGTGGNLGDKWFLEPFVGFIAVSTSFRYLEFFIRMRAADWHEGFPQAALLVDLLRKERVTRFGIYWRERWNCVELEGSASEGYDWARQVNSLFLQSLVRVWLTNCSVGTVGFEYQIGDSGLVGQGNSWRLVSSYRWIF